MIDAAITEATVDRRSPAKKRRLEFLDETIADLSDQIEKQIDGGVGRDPGYLTAAINRFVDAKIANAILDAREAKAEPDRKTTEEEHRQMFAAAGLCHCCGLKLDPDPDANRKNAAKDARIAELERERDEANARYERTAEGSTELQRHRDAWRAYAYGRGPKPDDWLDGNIAEGGTRPNTAIEKAEAALAELRADITDEIAPYCDDIPTALWVKLIALLSPEGEAKGEDQPPRDADPVPGTDLTKLATAVLNIATSTPKPLGLSKARMLAEQALDAVASAGITQGGTDV